MLHGGNRYARILLTIVECWLGQSTLANVWILYCQFERQS